MGDFLALGFNAVVGESSQDFGQAGMSNKFRQPETPGPQIVPAGYLNSRYHPHPLKRGSAGAEAVYYRPALARKASRSPVICL